jgi:cytochrome c oxidase cbb3-type subunit 3
MADDKGREIDDVSGQATTGHEWDGIKELDTPLPRWWLYLFYACILGSVVYWVMMPAWPGLPGMPASADHTTGVRGHSDRALLANDVAALQGQRADSFARLSGLSFAEIEADPALFDFARAAGESVFGNSCATCHGASGQGQLGYPSLQDDVWLWSGTLDGIVHTLNVGIRSEHPETQINSMPAFGLAGMLSREQIDDVTEHVIQLSSGRSGESFDATQAARGAAIFQVQCASCHGVSGEGQAIPGAPSLQDDIWLYGGSRSQIRSQIVSGRGGVMPAWSGVYDENTIRAIAIYVYGLGGGQPDPVPVASPEPAVAPLPETPLR